MTTKGDKGGKGGKGDKNKGPKNEEVIQMSTKIR